MNKTVCLYYEDQYLKEFEADVLSCTQVKDGLYDIILDKTAFFPEQGGQICDIGTIDDVAVKDVQIKNDIIHHYCEKPMEIGRMVKGKIDFVRRYDLMQNHTGEHLLSGIVHNRYGYENVGFHLNDHLCTVDYDGELTDAQIDELEILVNKAIYENITVEVSYPSKEELNSINFRSKKEIENQIRIVTIGDKDCCACCAPHVTSTGEIGIIKVIDRKKHKNGVRLTLLCGERALKDYQSIHKTVKQAAQFYSTSPDNIMERIRASENQIAELRHQLNSLMTDILIARLKTEKILFLDDVDQNTAIKAVNEYIDDEEFHAVFAGSDETGYRVISNNSDMVRISTLDFKGGNKGKMFFGKAQATAAEIRSFFLK